MKKRSIIILILSFIIPILVVIILVMQTPKTSPLDNQGLLNCNLLTYNGQNKINLLFFSTKEDAEKYSGELFSFVPLDKNKEAFNIYYIPPEDYSPKCELYQNIALLCYSKELIKISGSCPTDYIIVIEDQDSAIRSSSYMNVISINKKLITSVIAHEFGHAFVNFAEEYTPANLQFGQKNCASQCSQFNKLNNSCFMGCSKSDYFRSIDQGIMRTLYSETYGEFNQQLIAEKIFKSQKITGNAITSQVDCSTQEYYLITGKYNSDSNSINIIEKTIRKGCVGSSGSGPFNYNIEKNDGSIISSGEFNPEFIFTDTQQQGDNQISGGDFNSDREFNLKIPIIQDYSSLNILKENSEVLRVSLSDIGGIPCQI